MKKLNVGIVGYGWVATAHIAAINASAHAQTLGSWGLSPYSAMRPQVSHINARTNPAVGYLLVQKFIRSSGKRYSSELALLCSVGIARSLSMFGYLASIPFFVALYQGFKLLRFIGEHKAFSLSSVKTLRTIRYCAIILSASIVMAAVYIGVFHNKNDDPAGFIAMCFVTTFISIVIATSAAVFEKLLQNAVDIKSENDLTV